MGFRIDTKEGKMSSDKAKDSIWKTVLGLAIAAILIWMVKYSIQWRADGGTLWSLTTKKQDEAARKQSEHELIPQPMNAVISIDETWRGVVCLDPRMRIDSKILTDDVYWEIRYDKDDKKIYKLYPRNRDAKAHFEYPVGANVMEWRVSPGQPIKTALMAYSIHPKSDGAGIAISNR